MAITPVMSLGLNGNNYNTSFTGRKNNNDGFEYQSNEFSSKKASALKAVPLMTLLAMSPLNTANINDSKIADFPEEMIELVETSDVNDISSVSAAASSKVILASNSFRQRGRI